MRGYAEKDSATERTRSGKKRKHEASDFASSRWAEQVERIGLNGEWNFDLADSMPDLITALPCWQESGLVLHVRSGLSNMPYGESECSIGDVHVEVAGSHYWALINGKRVWVNSDGNCFFSAIWKALRASRHVDAVRHIFGGNVPANEQDASDYFRKEIRKYALNHPELESLLLVGNNSVGDLRSKPQRSCKVRKTCPAPVPELVKTTGLDSGVDGVQEGEAARFFRNAIKNCIVQNPERFGEVSESPAARNETDADDLFDASDVAAWPVQPGTQSGPADSGAASLHQMSRSQKEARLRTPLVEPPPIQRACKTEKDSATGRTRSGKKRKHEASDPDQMPRSKKEARWRTPLVELPPIQRACQTEFQRVLFHAGRQFSGWIAHSALIKWGYLALNTVWPLAGVVVSVAAAIYQVVTVLTRGDVLGGLIQTLLALPYQLLSPEFLLFSIAETTKQYIDDMLGMMVPEFVSDHQEFFYTCIGIVALFSYFGYFARSRAVNRFIDYFFPASKASSPNGFLLQNNVEPPQTPLGQGLVGMISKLQHVVQGYAVLQAIVNAVPRTGGDDEPVDDRGFTILSPELKARQRQERRERAEREKTHEARLARRLARTVANKGSIEGRTDALNHTADTFDNSMESTKTPYLPNSEPQDANIASDVQSMSNAPPTDLLDIATAVPALLTLASVIASSGTAGPPSQMRSLMLAVVLMTNLGDGRVGRYISAESEPSNGLNPSNSSSNVNISELVSRAVGIDDASGDLLKGIIAHEMDNGLFYRELSNSFKPSDDNDVSPEEQLYRRAIAMAVEKYKARPPGDQTDADISAFSYFGDSILNALKESTSENLDVSETRWRIISDLVALKAFISFSRSSDGVSKQPKNIVHLEDVLKIPHTPDQIDPKYLNSDIFSELSRCARKSDHQTLVSQSLRLLEEKYLAILRDKSCKDVKSARRYFFENKNELSEFINNELKEARKENYEKRGKYYVTEMEAASRKVVLYALALENLPKYENFIDMYYFVLEEIRPDIISNFGKGEKWSIYDARAVAIKYVIQELLPSEQAAIYANAEVDELLDMFGAIMGHSEEAGWFVKIAEAALYGKSQGYSEVRLVEESSNPMRLIEKFSADIATTLPYTRTTAAGHAAIQKSNEFKREADYPKGPAGRMAYYKQFADYIDNDLDVASKTLSWAVLAAQGVHPYLLMNDKISHANVIEISFIFKDYTDGIPVEYYPEHKREIYWLELLNKRCIFLCDSPGGVIVRSYSSREVDENKFLKDIVRSADLTSRSKENYSENRWNNITSVLSELTGLQVKNAIEVHPNSRGKTSPLLDLSDRLVKESWRKHVISIKESKKAWYWSDYINQFVPGYSTLNGMRGEEKSTPSLSDENLFRVVLSSNYDRISIVYHDNSLTDFMKEFARNTGFTVAERGARCGRVR